MNLATEWKHYNPVIVYFGSEFDRTLISKFDLSRTLVVTTPGMIERGYIDHIEKLFQIPLKTAHTILASPNPEITLIEALRSELKGQAFSAIMALGGGSAIDTAKTLSLVLNLPATFQLNHYFSGSSPLPNISTTPLLAIPTTAGSGSEVTPFATIWDKNTPKKHSLSSPMLYPRAAWLNPEFTKSVNIEITLSCALDAFSQALESIWNKNATPCSIAFAMQAAAVSWRILPKISLWPISERTRVELMHASLLAGLAISQTRTAIAHSISYPITLFHDLPHGFACSFTLPYILTHSTKHDDGRLEHLSQYLGFSSTTELADSVMSLFIDLDIRKFIRKYAKDGYDADKLAPHTITLSRSENYIYEMNAKGIHNILARALGKFS